ncbi:MAG: hypothetical protein ABSH48_11880 [Verrucomicrobiota bacterium]|jgi:hypothetical protein
MGSRWKPVIALLLITPFLTELLSGNLPPSVFFRPQVFLCLATIAYGFPVVLLREFAVRRQLGLAGLFLLGLVYGIFNEGILAKTFYLATNVPIRNFDGYGFVFGMAIPWAITISLWHALHSFIYPVVAISYFFPEHRQSPWLTWRASVWLAAPTVAVGSLVFFLPGNGRPRGDAVHFIVMLAVICLLLWLALRLGCRPALAEPEPLRSRAFFIGVLAFFLFLFVPVVLAWVKIPLWGFYAFMALLIFLLLHLLRRRASLSVNSVLLFAVGDDTLMALFGLVAAIAAGGIQRIASNAGFLFLFGWLWLRLRISARPPQQSPGRIRFISDRFSD